MKMMKLTAALALAQCLALLGGMAAEPSQKLVSRRDFRIRDPFVLVDGGRYYLYESKPWSGGRGVDVRESTDLENWTEKRPVMQLADETDCTAIWAPEVHRFGKDYWLFVTLTQSRKAGVPKAMSAKADPKRLRPRGTWVFKAPSPCGPFVAVKDGPVPPAEMMTLDGTLYVEDGKPYMAYCHEWCQMANGTIEYAPLKDGFASFADAPKKLLDARSAMPGAGKITDGVFFWRSEKSGRLYMIWSNHMKDCGYCVLIRRSESGTIAGPWSKDRLLFRKDGGHGMIFKGLDGKLRLTLHQPNSGSLERMQLFELADDGEWLVPVAPKESGGDGNMGE